MSLADDAKLLLIPTGYKTSKVYSVFPTDGDGDFTYTRSGDASRVNPGGLIETVGTNIPRIDHTGGGCPTLNLEPQRTNLQIRSEEFDNSAWVKSRTTITGNNAISPNGELTADKLTGTGTGASYIYDSVTFTSGIKYNISIFVKAINVTTFIIQKFSGGTGAASFNLSTGTINSVSGTMSNPIIESLPNGWFRCSVEHTPTATGTQNYGFGVQNYNGDQFYLFGAQVEEGYLTSYIKTTTGTVTRQKDQCLNGGDSDLFNVSELSWFVDVTNFATPLNNFCYITITDGQSSPVNMIRLTFETTRILVNVYDNGAFELGYNITSITANQRNKILLTFDGNEAKVYFNGVLKNTSTNVPIPTGIDSLSFTNRTENGRNFEGKVHDTRVYDRVLTEAEAIELTTL